MTWFVVFVLLAILLKDDQENQPWMQPEVHHELPAFMMTDTFLRWHTRKIELELLDKAIKDKQQDPTQLNKFILMRKLMIASPLLTLQKSHELVEKMTKDPLNQLENVNDLTS